MLISHHAIVFGALAGFTQANQSRTVRTDGVYDVRFGIVSEVHTGVEMLGS